MKKLYIAGFGPGSRDGMTLRAQAAVEAADLVVGYTVYTEIISRYFPGKAVFSTPMRQERDRVAYALRQAVDGSRVCLVCSGDSQLYGMAGLALEMAADFPEVDVEIIPGVTAALSGGALLGAPLTHDFAVISLSDLLTPLATIYKRLQYAAMGDFTVVLYNPSSKKRRDYLQKACEILLQYKSPETVCGTVTNIGREGERCKLFTLKALRKEEVDMFTTVFIGNSETRVINGKMVTPRGYRHD